MPIATQDCKSYVADATDTGTRLDRFLASRIETLSRARLQELIRTGHVAGDGRAITDPNSRVREGDSFEVKVPPPETCRARPEPIGLEVVHEDESLIVINKPAGLVVHPGAGNLGGTLVNALLAHCGETLSGIGGVTRPGIVHRLDKDTSGLMVVAKTDRAHRGLALQFARHGGERELSRQYIAIVWGAPSPSIGRIETLIGRHPASRTRMAVVPAGGRPAITKYETARVFRLRAEGTDFGLGTRVASQRRNNVPVLSVVRCGLETGRTHQIRVHMAHIGNPIAGDKLYGAGFATKANALPEEAGDALRALGRQALHAASLHFRHPLTGKVMAFEVKLPQEIANFCNALERLETKLSKN
ncbi:MAG: pseudouridine synthase [Rhodomicrobium sp.]